MRPNLVETKWRISRQISLSVLIQLILLASLIIGSWVNLQRQLDRLGRDVAELLERQKKLDARFEQVRETQIGYEYRLRSLEKPDVNTNQ